VGSSPQATQRNLLVDGGVAGKTVLVAGGAGAVGHYAVQFAARMGATTVEVASSHVAMVSHPTEVTDLLKAAAEAVAAPA